MRQRPSRTSTSSSARAWTPAHEIPEGTLATGLAPLTEHPLVSEVRTGAGLLAAVQLEPAQVEADATLAGRGAAACRAAGVITCAGRRRPANLARARDRRGSDRRTRGRVARRARLALARKVLRFSRRKPPASRSRSLRRTTPRGTARRPRGRTASRRSVRPLRAQRRAARASRYGRDDVIASKASATARIRPRAGSRSPARRVGYPAPSQRSWWKSTYGSARTSERTPAISQAPSTGWARIWAISSASSAPGFAEHLGPERDLADVVERRAEPHVVEPVLAPAEPRAIVSASAPDARGMTAEVGVADAHRGGVRVRVRTRALGSRRASRSLLVPSAPMRVAVPRETAPGERRVALVPDVVQRLTAGGFEFAVERGAGEAAGFADSRLRGSGRGHRRTGRRRWTAPPRSFGSRRRAPRRSGSSRRARC